VSSKKKIKSEIYKMALNIKTNKKMVSSPLSLAASLLAPHLKNEMLSNGGELSDALSDAVDSCESMATVTYLGNPSLVIEGKAVNSLISLNSPEYTAFVQKSIKLACGKVSTVRAVEAAIAAQVSNALIDGEEIEASEFNTYLDVDGSTSVVLCCNDTVGTAVQLNDGEVTKIDKPTGLTFVLKPKNGRVEFVNDDLSVEQRSQFRELFSNLDDHQFNLLIAYVTFILAHPRTEGLSYPIAYIHGGAGTGKTTISRMIAKLLGMRQATIKTMPKSLRDLVATAANDHLMIFDNVSNIKNPMSNAFCSVSTGGTVGDRKLYSNNEISETSLHQPMVITAIELSKQHDLMSRCIFFAASKPTVSYATENDMYQILDAMLPQVQSWLLKISAKALMLTESVKSIATHRASAFCVWTAAMESVLDVKAQELQKYFETSFKETLKMQAVTYDPVLSSIISAITELKHISGTPTNIHRSLTNHIEVNEGRVPRKWPANSNALSNKLGTIDEHLAKHGVLFEKDLKRDNKGGKKWILSIVQKAKVVETSTLLKPSVTLPTSNIGTVLCEKSAEPTNIDITTEDNDQTNQEINTDDIAPFAFELDETATEFQFDEKQPELDLELSTELDIELEKMLKS